MIVDKLLDDSRGGEGLLDAAGDCGLMTSPLNLAYFYGASPPSAPGAGDTGYLSAVPSAPGSPGSDSSDFSSTSSVSSCGAVESRPRGGARAERPQGTHSRDSAPLSSGFTRWEDRAGLPPRPPDSRDVKRPLVTSLAAG